MDTNINILEDFNQIEFHYIFEDDSEHSLDAFTRNSCEKEFLNLVKTIASELGINLSVTTEPKKKGSLIDVYNFLVSQNGLAIAVWATFFLEVFKYVFPRKSKEDKEAVKLANEKSLMELVKQAKEMEDEGLPIPLNIQKKLECVYSSRKIKKQKSNFFRNLMNEKKIKALEVLKPTMLEEKVLFTIPRSAFEDYFLDSDDLESEIDNKAIVEVISPVLKNGKYMWRGIYRKENKIHEFVMLDKDFKKTVIDDGVSFQNGTELDCEIEICKKLDDNGDVFNSKYKINKVYDHRIGEITTEMPSGKRRRIAKELEQQQPSLFDDLNAISEENK